MLDNPMLDNPTLDNPMLDNRMLNNPILGNPSEQIQECHRHAEYCALQASGLLDSELREDFLRIERRWLALARSYERSERIGSTSASGVRPAHRPAPKVFDAPTNIEGEESRPEGRS
jgi:hypothetical protein